MRDLKFRAWDGESIRYDVTGFEHGQKNEMEGVFLDGDYHKLNDPAFHAWAYVMQYTGLKDKNGIEIYEGDIVELADIRCPITFDDGAFQMITSSSQGRSLAMQERLKKWEVIGNIYENPELLKGA